MAQFRYTGIAPGGGTESGVIDAGDASQAFASLRAAGVTPYQLDPVDGAAPPRVPWYAREVSFGGGGIALSDQATMADMIGTLSQLGLPATDMLRILAGAAPTPTLRRHVERVAARVADGVPLGRAFQAAGAGFSPLFTQLLVVADDANTLPRAMAELARALRRMDRLRGRVGGALIYPAILVAAALGVLTIMVLYLAPALAPTFAALDRPLPGALAVMMRLNGVLTNGPWWVAPAGIVALLAALILLLRSTGRRLLMRLPLFGPLARDGLLLRHATALEMLLSSGMPLADALELAGQVQPTSPFAARFADAADRLRQGQRATGAFTGQPGLPPLFSDLFALGEEANALDRTMASLNQMLEQRLDRRIARALQTLTPVLTLVIGGLIGALVYVVMGALLDVNTVAF